MSTEFQESTRTTEYVNNGERTSSQDPMRGQMSGEAPVSSTDTGAAALFGSQEATDFRVRWKKIQIGFVDEPRKSVEQADDLVATVTERLEQMFRDQKERLEHEWDKGEISTEELRTAFRRYRALCDRLLSI